MKQTNVWLCMVQYQFFMLMGKNLLNKFITFKKFIISKKFTIQNLFALIYFRKERSSGVFWHNTAETWIDILSSADNNVVESIVNFVSGSTKKFQVDAHFMSESGVIDVFFMLGPKPLDVLKQYTILTGTAPLPQVNEINIVKILLSSVISEIF